MKIKLLDPASSGRVNAKAQSTDRSRDLVPLVARILIAAIFIWSGANKILHPIGTQEYMAASGMALAGLLLPVAIALELAGGLSLLLGYKTRLGAAILIIFLIPATLIFHTDFADPIQQIMFMKNLSMLGGLLMVLHYGAGQLSLDRHH